MLLFALVGTALVWMHFAIPIRACGAAVRHGAAVAIAVVGAIVGR